VAIFLVFAERVRDLRSGTAGFPRGVPGTWRWSSESSTPCVPKKREGETASRAARAGRRDLPDRTAACANRAGRRERRLRTRSSWPNHG